MKLRGTLLFFFCGSLLFAAPSRGALSLDEALRLARAGSPDLRALRAKARGAEARRVDAGSAANPDLAVASENLGIEGRAETAVTLRQPIELGGARGARRDEAEALARQSLHELSGAERAVLAETAERFVEVWALQQRKALLEAGLAHAAQAVEAARERFRAGAGPEVERVRGEARRALRAAEAKTAAGELEAAKRRLALQWGGEAVDDSVSLGPPDMREIPPADSLVAALALHPDQLAAAAAVAVEEARIREARAMRVPQLGLEAGVKRLAETASTGAIAGVAVSLPLWSRGRGAEAAAVAEREAAAGRQEAGKRQLSAEIRSARERLTAALDALASVRDDGVPKSREALDLIAGGYRAGRFSYVELADAQRDLLEAETAAVQAAADAWRARTALARLAGVPLTSTLEGGSR